jgi:hypothetical protein
VSLAQDQQFVGGLDLDFNLCLGLPMFQMKPSHERTWAERHLPVLR